MDKFKFYLVCLDNYTVYGTNDESEAMEFSNSEQWIVIEPSTNSSFLDGVPEQINSV